MPPPSVLSAAVLYFDLWPLDHVCCHSSNINNGPSDILLMYSAISTLITHIYTFMFHTFCHYQITIEFHIHYWALHSKNPSILVSFILFNRHNIAPQNIFNLVIFSVYHFQPYLANFTQVFTLSTLALLLSKCYNSTSLAHKCLRGGRWFFWFLCNCRLSSSCVCLV